MKIRSEKSELVAALAKVQSVAGTRTTLPITAHVLIEAKSGFITMTATDMEFSIKTTCAALVIEEGAATLPARRLFAICKEMQHGEITIEINDSNVASISSGSSKFKLEGLNASDFPQLPEMSGIDTYSVEESLLLDAFRKTSYAASADESRHIITGINMLIDGGKMSIAATDGRRLALVEQDIRVGIYRDLLRVTIPQKTVSELIKTLGGGELVSIRKSDSQISFEFDGATIISKLIDGNFPNYRQVIPNERGEKIEINREQFMSAIRRVSVMLDDQTAALRLTISNDQIELCTASADVGEALETFAVKYSGNPLSVAFNPAFLSAPMKQLDEDIITMSILDDLSPGIIESEKSAFLYVIMPIRL